MSSDPITLRDYINQLQRGRAEAQMADVLAALPDDQRTEIIARLHEEWDKTDEEERQSESPAEKEWLDRTAPWEHWEKTYAHQNAMIDKFFDDAFGKAFQWRRALEAQGLSEDQIDEAMRTQDPPRD